MEDPTCIRILDNLGIRLSWISWKWITKNSSIIRTIRNKLKILAPVDIQIVSKLYLLLKSNTYPSSNNRVTPAIGSTYHPGLTHTCRCTNLQTSISHRGKQPERNSKKRVCQKEMWREFSEAAQKKKTSTRTPNSGSIKTKPSFARFSIRRGVASALTTFPSVELFIAYIFSD